MLQAAREGTGVLAVGAHMTWPFAAGQGAKHEQSGLSKAVQAKLAAVSAVYGEDEEAATGLRIAARLLAVWL